MRMTKRRVPIAAALTVVLAAGGACTPSGEDGRTRQPMAAGAADPGWTVQPVPMPDISRLPVSVQTQVRDRYAALSARSASSQMPPEELAQAHGDVGLILMATGYHAAAETSLRNAQALAPRNPKWPYYLGQLYLITSDHANTLKSFERALELSPKDLPTIVRLGEAYLDQGQTDKAERLFLQARDIDPRSPAAIEGLGRVAQARGDHARAVEYLEQTLTLDPQATRVHYPLAQSYRSLGQHEKAEAHVKQRGDGRPGLSDPLMRDYYWLVDSAEAHYQRGVLAMQAGKWDAAADLFRKGLALEPENVQLGYGLGLALYWQGDQDAAAKQFEAVLQRSPDHVETRFNLAALLAQQKHYREALTHFDAVAKLDPGRADVQVGQAEMLRNLGDLNASIPHWRRAIELDPANAVAWAEGAKALIALKRYQQARDWLDAARKLHPDRVELSALSADLTAVSGQRN
jgi:tetratricopeptide (TPR) repeat protein